MRSKKESVGALERLFNKSYVVKLEDLLNVLGVSSRVSAFRRLRLLNYVSSFTHAGSYYTIKEVCQFDRNGLWFYDGVGFSQDGTLRATIVRLVEQSERAKTQRDLEDQ